MSLSMCGSSNRNLILVFLFGVMASSFFFLNWPVSIEEMYFCDSSFLDYFVLLTKTWKVLLFLVRWAQKPNFLKCIQHAMRGSEDLVNR